MGQKNSRSGDGEPTPPTDVHRDGDYGNQFKSAIKSIKSGNIEGITNEIYWKKPTDRMDAIRVWGKFWDATQPWQWADLVDLGVIISLHTLLLLNTRHHQIVG
jgi:hypothetical protein